MAEFEFQPHLFNTGNYQIDDGNEAAIAAKNFALPIEPVRRSVAEVERQLKMAIDELRAENKRNLAQAAAEGLLDVPFGTTRD